MNKENTDIKILIGDIYLRAKELCEAFVGTSQSTVSSWADSGLINRYKIKGGIYYSLSEVKHMIENSIVKV